MQLRVVLLAAVASLGAAAEALADSRMTESGGVLYFRSEDAGVGNRLTIDRDARNRLRFFDDADAYGITYPRRCSPGRINNAGNPIEVFCDPAGINRVLVQSGPGEDRLTSSLDLAVTMEGEVGADALRTAGGPDRVGGGQGDDTIDTGAGDDLATGSEGNDKLATGDGNDQADGGPGQDDIDAGAGDDLVVDADGYADTIRCGAGTDTVTVDALDSVVDCESVTRRDVPAAGGQTTADRTRPVVRVGGLTSQRVSTKRRRLSVAVTSSEPARVDVSGFVEAGGLFRRLTPVTGRIEVGGGGATVRLVLSPSQARAVLRDLRRGRRPVARITVSAVDGAGNTSATRRLSVRLRR